MSDTDTLTGPSSNGDAHAATIATSEPFLKSADGVRPAAILYVPGLRAEQGEAQTIVAKLTEALTTYGGDGSAMFTSAKQARDSASDAVDSYTISMSTAQNGSRPAFEFFTLDYQDDVVGEYSNASPLLKALQLVFSLHWLAPALVKTLLRGYRKSASQRRQLWYVLAILLGLALYFVLTVIAVVKIVLSATTASGTHVAQTHGFHFAAWFAKLVPSLAFLVGNRPTLMYPHWQAAETPLFLRSVHLATSYVAQYAAWGFENAYYHLIAAPGSWMMSQSALLVVATTALGVALPKVRKNFEDVMNHMLAAIEYFRIGFARNKTTGHFHKTFGDLCADDRFECVHVLGYSFGSIVALDSLFYTRGVTGKPSIDRLGNLITIGAPITMAQTLWPKHFDVIRYRFADPAKHAWINAQCALDVLASPILDRIASHVVFVDPNLPSSNKGNVPAWEAFRRRELKRQLRAVDADPGDPNNINFGRSLNLDYAGWYPLDLDIPEFFSLAALRAHKMYWAGPKEVDYNAFARIAPEIFPDGAAPSAPVSLLPAGATAARSLN